MSATADPGHSGDSAADIRTGPASDTTVTPVNTTTGAVGKAITVGGSTQIIAITPNGKTVYAINDTAGLVTPIPTATNRPG